MTPTPAQDTESRACWNSTAYLFQMAGLQPPPTGSGIFQAWQSDWINKGKQYGPPLTREYPSNDWNGNPITAQEFAHARCEYTNGVASWYGAGGKIA